jgi:hypothetical protein
MRGSAKAVHFRGKVVLAAQGSEGLGIVGAGSFGRKKGEAAAGGGCWSSCAAKAAMADAKEAGCEATALMRAKRCGSETS